MSAIDRFRDLHVAGTFVMPNAWDIGSARLLEQLGFVALATTSSGHAGSLGRLDQHVSRDELVAHAEALATSVGVPLSVDAEGCFPDQPGGVERTVSLLATTGAAGCSIEDYDPRDRHDPAARRRRRARRRGGRRRAEPVASCSPRAPRTSCTASTTSTTRSPGSSRTGSRAPTCSTRPASPSGPTSNGSSGRPAARSTCWPARERRASPSSPTAGVRRVSTGGALAWVAYGALVEAGRELLERGTTSYLARSLTAADRVAAFDH